MRERCQLRLKISHFCRSLCRLRGILTLTCFPGSGPRIVRKLSVRFSVTNRGASREEVEFQRTADCVHSAPGGGRNERRGGLLQGGDFSADLLLNEHLPGGLARDSSRKDSNIGVGAILGRFGGLGLGFGPVTGESPGRGATGRAVSAASARAERAPAVWPGGGALGLGGGLGYPGLSLAATKWNSAFWGQAVERWRETRLVLAETTAPIFKSLRRMGRTGRGPCRCP